MVCRFESDGVRGKSDESNLRRGRVGRSKVLKRSDSSVRRRLISFFFFLPLEVGGR